MCPTTRPVTRRGPAPFKPERKIRVLIRPGCLRRYQAPVLNKGAGILALLRESWCVPICLYKEPYLMGHQCLLCVPDEFYKYWGQDE
jgi:hypothetical protein